MAEGESPVEGGGAAPAQAPAEGQGLGFVMDVPLRVTVQLGATKMLLREVLQLDAGSVVELDRSADEPCDVLINGRVVAKGEVTVVDDQLAVRVVELVESPLGSTQGS